MSKFITSFFNSVNPPRKKYKIKLRAILNLFKNKFFI